MPVKHGKPECRAHQRRIVPARTARQTEPDSHTADAHSGGHKPEVAEIIIFFPYHSFVRSAYQYARLQPHCSKIAAGYVLILFVIFGIVYIWLNEQNRQQELEATTYKIRNLHKDVHEVYMKAVDLSMIGETDGSYIKYVHFFGGYMEEISYLCYVNNNTESNGDKL